MGDLLPSSPPKSPQFNEIYEAPLDEDAFEDKYSTLHPSPHCFSDDELNKSFQIFFEPLVCKCDLGFPDNFSILWSDISILKIRDDAASEQRSRISTLLMDIFASLETLDSTQKYDFFCRFIYIIKGINFVVKSATSSRRGISHIRLDILTMFLKLLEFRSISALREALELDPSSSNPQEYFMEWILDLLISESSSLCTCYSLLWLLLIRHAELAQKGWYKYLHAKMVQLQSGRRRVTYGSLDSIRGNTGLINSVGVLDKTRLWRVYWSVLVATAPLYERAKSLLNGFVRSPSTIKPVSKFSTAVWIIRNQFLADIPPSEESIRHALQSLLVLQNVWGVGIEPIRSLWLYFSRKLDSLTHVLSKDVSKGDSEVRPFYLFCNATLEAFLVYPTDVLNIIRIALPSLTRQGVTNYFILLENMLEPLLKLPQGRKVASELIEFVISLFGGVEAAQLKWSCDWEIGRRCAALDGLQRLLIDVLDASDSNDELETGLVRLIQLTSLFREVLLHQVKDDGLENNGSFSNFTLFGWRDKLEQMTLSFCKSLLPNIEKNLERILSLLDSSVLSLLFSSEHGDWLPFLRDFLSSPCLSGPACPSDLYERIWAEMFPQFVSRACSKYSLAKEAAEVAVEFLIVASNSPSSVPVSPWNLLQELVFNVDLTFLFRTMFLRRLFSNSNLLKCLLSKLTDDIEQAWQFYTIWLTFRLLCSSTADEHKILPELLSDRGYELPDAVSDCLGTTDTEISMIRLCNRFDVAETFQNRMAFKSATIRRLKPLGQLLNRFMEDFTTLPSPSSSCSDAEIVMAYRATASLFQVTAALLYSPDGVFNQLFTVYLMPPWRRLEKEAPDKKIAIQNCVAENLSAFLRGIAQLNFLKDPFINRMVRELLRTVFFTGPNGIDSVVSAIQISNSASYRVHLLKILAQEFIGYSETSLLDWDVNTNMWLNFCERMDEGTMTMAQRLKDAPYLLWPLAALLADSRSSKSSASITNRCHTAFSTFTSRWEDIKSADAGNLNTNELESLIDEISESVQLIYRLNTNTSVSALFNQIFKSLIFTE